MSENNIDIDYSWLAVAVLFIAFWGEPNLVDAIIHWLMH